MSKSRYAKTKAAGQAVGLSRYGKGGKNFGQQAHLVPLENRQMRRMRQKG